MGISVAKPGIRERTSRSTGSRDKGTRAKVKATQSKAKGLLHSVDHINPRITPATRENFITYMKT